MADRITLTKRTYMPLDGQWQVVEPGSVVDVADATPFVKVATVELGTGVLASHGKPRPHANIRTAK